MVQAGWAAVAQGAHQMTGPSALAAFERAAQLVKQGDFDAARKAAP